MAGADLCRGFLTTVVGCAGSLPRNLWSGILSTVAEFRRRHVVGGSMQHGIAVSDGRRGKFVGIGESLVRGPCSGMVAWSLHPLSIGLATATSSRGESPHSVSNLSRSALLTATFGAGVGSFLGVLECFRSDFEKGTPKWDGKRLGTMADET